MRINLVKVGTPDHKEAVVPTVSVVRPPTALAVLGLNRSDLASTSATVHGDPIKPSPQTHTHAMAGVTLATATQTSGQRNLTYGRIVAAHKWFNRIRQMAPMCTPSSTVDRTTSLTWHTRPSGILIRRTRCLELASRPTQRLRLH